ncbi:hypothetical protein PHMEG_00014807, partial [Phytophthora megakarya]
KETLEHIFWNCRVPQTCWKQCIEHWTGEQQTETTMSTLCQPGSASDHKDHTTISIADRRIRGTRLRLGIQILQHKPRGTPSQVDQFTGTQESQIPEIVKRLKTYQQSCNR